MRTRVLTAMWVYCIAQAAAADPDSGRRGYESRHMGVAFRAVAYGPDGAAAEAAADAAFARVAELERVLSDYRDDSEVMRLCRANDADPGKPRPASADLIAALSVARKVSAMSDGAFDVTVGPAVKLWRLARRTQRLPDPDELAAARAKIGFGKVSVDPAAGTVALAVPGMRLDFGGIGKGFAADAALKVLRDRGFPRALVAAAGDVAVGDPPPGEPGWAVDIAPLAAGRPARRLTLSNQAVSTSGDLFQFVEIGGVRYSHVVDPRTGVGLTGRRAATVVAPTGALADALSTAAVVLPPDRAVEVIDAVPGAAVRVTVADGDGERATRSKRFGGPGGE